MNDISAKGPRPFTLNDIRVGSKLFETLVRQARNHPGKSIYYGDLLAQARSDFPDDAEVQRAVPVGIGMKLLFVQAFCDANGYPNLACLVVNRGKDIPGIAYPGDWEREKAEVAAFDWASVQAVLSEYVQVALAAATPLRRIKEADAREALFAHFKENRAAYAPLDNYDKEELVGILMSGVPVGQALASVLEAKAALA